MGTRLDDIWIVVACHLLREFLFQFRVDHSVLVSHYVEVRLLLPCQYATGLKRFYVQRFSELLWDKLSTSDKSPMHSSSRDL